jgi:energy-coupling factor transport system permease protein
MVIGKDITADSPLHRLNPAVKLIIFIAFMQMAGKTDSAIDFVWFAILTIVAAYFAKLDLFTIISKIKPFLLILVFTLLINMFFGSGTNHAVILSLRFLFIILFSIILTLTTAPKTLVSVILFPMKGKIGHNLKVVMLVALEFIPHFVDQVKGTAKEIRAIPEYSVKPYKALTKPELYIKPIMSNLISHSEAVSENVGNEKYKTEPIEFPKPYEIILTATVLIIMVKYAL